MTSAEIEKLLSANSIRPTANRILICRTLADAMRPLSLADLVTALDTLDKASIFRVLELFAQKEVVHTIEDGSRAIKYELCRSHDHHSIADQHAHFYCENCKETFCFENAVVPVINVPEGFQPHAVNYMLKGLCPKCARR